jgi:signal peptidase I
VVRGAGYVSAQGASQPLIANRRWHRGFSASLSGFSEAQKLVSTQLLDALKNMGPEGEDLRKPGWVRRVLIGKNPTRTLARIVFWILLLVVIRTYVLLPIRVEGVSMLPTYKENGINFINCLAYTFHPPQRGDVVAISYSPTFRSIMLCKRIVGLPGEILAFHDGHVEINGERLDEPYLARRCNWERAPERIGPDEYYVVGDNRSMDFEQHTQGRAKRSRIVGKILL